MTDKILTIRRADVTDAGALVRLAELDSSAPPKGETLVAEMGDELWAAIELDSGATIADPFRPSGELVDLLRLRAELVGGAASRERRAAARLRPRAA
jgi:hypothetical protein